MDSSRPRSCPASPGITGEMEFLRGLLGDPVLQRLHPDTRKLLRLKIELTLATADPASDPSWLRRLADGVETQSRSTPRGRRGHDRPSSRAL